MPPQQTSASTGPEGVFSSVASSTRPDEGVSRHRARLCPGPETGLHCRAGPIQSGVENVPNTFEDGWCTPSAATHNHQRCHADTGQPCTNLKQAAHSKKHKTTHTHRSTPTRHRARLCPGPKTGLHCRAGPIQSGVENVPNTFEDGWCTPFAATGDHQGWHADTGQPCTNTLEARPGGGGGHAGPSRGGVFSPGTQTPLLGVAAFFLSPGMLENLHGRPE